MLVTLLQGLEGHVAERDWKLNVETRRMRTGQREGAARGGRTWPWAAWAAEGWGRGMQPASQGQGAEAERGPERLSKAGCHPCEAARGDLGDEVTDQAGDRTALQSEALAWAGDWRQNAGHGDRGGTRPPHQRGRVQVRVSPPLPSAPLQTHRQPAVPSHSARQQPGSGHRMSPLRGRCHRGGGGSESFQPP